MTIRNILKFTKICNFLEIDLDSEDNFNKRLLIQKIFYFLKKNGVDLGCKYNFYKHGPYSPELTDIYYSVLDIPINILVDFPKIEFNQHEKKNIKKMKDIYQEWGNDLRKLEFYASVLYVYKDMYIKDRNSQRIEEVVKNLKKELSQAFGVDGAVNELIEKGFL